MVQKLDRDLPDFVGRERKGQAVFSACTFERFRGCWETVLGKMTESGRRIVVRSGGMEAEVFQLPQGLGIIYENSFQKKV